MNINVTLSQQAEFAMPVCGGGLVAAVRALPMSVGAPVSAATADSKPRFDTTTVSGYRHITDVVVLTGAFPGTSAWSPPI
jgi:hypothetical protein